MSDEIVSKVIEVLEEYGLSVDANSPLTLHLSDDLGLDSLSKMEIFMLLEDYFEVEIDNELLYTLETIEDIVNIIEEHGGL